MKKAASILYYHFFTFIRSSKYIVPLIFLLVLQTSIYFASQRRPVDFLNAILIAETYAFIIAIWLGFSSNGWINQTTEQLLIVRSKSDLIYYSIDAVFLFVISLLISLICAFLPVLINLFDPYFFHQYLMTDFIYSFLLILGISFAGISLGALFHPRIIQKKSAIIYTFLVGILSVARIPILSQQEGLRYLLWILPRLSAESLQLSDYSSFIFPTVAKISLLSLLYGLFYSFIKILLLSKKKY